MAILTSSDLAKSHGATPVLRSVTFSVESAEKVALIGRNGSGKTTLLRLLTGLEDPDRGSVSRARWAKVGYLAQIPTGPGDVSVLSHVLSRGCRRARARGAAAGVRTPDGRPRSAR